jgi:hypothetical protein
MAALSSSHIHTLSGLSIEEVWFGYAYNGGRVRSFLSCYRRVQNVLPQILQQLAQTRQDPRIFVNAASYLLR